MVVHRQSARNRFSLFVVVDRIGSGRFSQQQRTQEVGQRKREGQPTALAPRRCSASMLF